ncbi:hypothetical protein PJL18_02436 [Paenarthrobacter nicotinovorans]|nr:hypothetical protein [Paenarthrobacter nicotinovorans]
MAALSAMISLVTEKGEHGASAICTTAPSPVSWYWRISRSLSARIASGDWTVVLGGSPPSSSPSVMDPRVSVARMPMERTAATSISMASSMPSGKR